MNKAQAIRTKALDKHVVDIIVAPTIQSVAFFPIPTHAHHLQRVFRERHNIRKLDFCRLAVLILVLKPRNLQIDLHFQQKNLFRLVRWTNANDFVRCFYNLSRIRGLLFRLKVDIPVLTSDYALAKLVRIHRNPVRNPRTLRNYARSVVRDVQVISQNQLTDHPTQLMIVINLLKRRTTIPGVKQQLVKLRRVLTHHVSNLVIHEVLDTRSLLDFVRSLFAHDFSAHRATRRHQFLERLRLELDDRLGQQRMRCI